MIQKPINTEQELNELVDEMVKDLERKLDFSKRCKVIKGKKCEKNYIINIIDDDACPIITSSVIETAAEVMNAYNLFYQCLFFYHAGVYEYNGFKLPTIEISIAGLF